MTLSIEVPRSAAASPLTMRANAERTRENRAAGVSDGSRVAAASPMSFVDVQSSSMTLAAADAKLARPSELLPKACTDAEAAGVETFHEDCNSRSTGLLWAGVGLQTGEAVPVASEWCGDEMG
mmetsp:Transcript_3991/g.11088  ORF Transcript_3991/g.11088 Transcript_3991/m.11088 type:complete len:123 (+) Transcript_3991:741-1109(+)